MAKRILEYLRTDGSSPFGAWFDRLEPVAAAKVATAQARMAAGNFGDHRNLAGGIRECRIDCGPGYRIYLALDGDKVVILLLGGSKKRQSADIRLATEYWQDYLARRRQTTQRPKDKSRWH